MGTPCTTWSRARKDDGGPPPLRDDAEFLWGFHNLSPSDQRKIEDGNQLLHCSVRVAELCTKLLVPWVLENPASSRIFDPVFLLQIFVVSAPLGENPLVSCFSILMLYNL